MRDRPMSQMSLRRFRDTIGEIRQPVEVSRRDSEGNIVVLGVWTPYVFEARNSMGEITVTTKTIESPNTNGEPAVIRTPAEAAAVVRADPVRAVPKPSQRKKG